MKHPIGNAPPRQLAKPRRQVQLDLRRSRSPEPDDERDTERKTTFWKWVCLVTLLHLLVFCLVYWIYTAAPQAPKPPEQFMTSFVPPGDVVKGAPGIQQAPKVGPTTPAPSVHHTVPPPEPAPPKPPTPVAVKPPPPPEVVPPKPVVQQEAPPLVPEKPIVPKPVPPKPTVKLTKNDLKLVDAATDKPVKPKPHIKKPVAATPPDDSTAPDRDSPSNPDSTGLSKEQIAAALGEKLKASGTEKAEKTGASGAENSEANPFADFYLSVRDQVMSKWEHPNLVDDTAINPEMMIHVEKDGRIPPESVTLTRSSGNPAYDDSAVAAAKSLGYTLQPLPDGCPPDIHITFKLTR